MRFRAIAMSLAITTASKARKTSRARQKLAPGQAGVPQLSARSPGVHVDFHANLHFSDLRLFPDH
jgi:hypothetical protein